MKIGKTVVGGIVAVLGYLSQPDVFAVLPEKVSHIIAGLGVLLSIFGVRHAISKNGNGA